MDLKLFSSFEIYVLIFILLVLYSLFVFFSYRSAGADSSSEKKLRIATISLSAAGLLIHGLVFLMALRRGASPEEILLFLMISSLMGFSAMKITEKIRK